MMQKEGIEKQVLHTGETRGRLTKEHRRLMLLKRTGLFGTNIFGAEITRACLPKDLREAYRLVYDVFLDAGYVTPNECKMRIRTFDAIPDTATFIARREGKVIGVLSMVVDYPDLGLPSDELFKKEVDAIRSSGMRLCESTNLAMIPIFRKTTITTQLMQCGCAQALMDDRDGIIISVGISHTGFYKLMGFQQMSEVRSYSPSCYDPVVMMLMDMIQLKKKDPNWDSCQGFVSDYLSFENPFVGKVDQWRQEARRQFFETDQLQKLFLVESGLLARCTNAEREAIRKNWGEGTYISVMDTAKSRHNPRSVGNKKPLTAPTAHATDQQLGQSNGS